MKYELGPDVALFGGKILIIIPLLVDQGVFQETPIVPLRIIRPGVGTAALLPVKGSEGHRLRQFQQIADFHIMDKGQIVPDRCIADAIWPLSIMWKSAIC